jgi:release factor glutamine methyltransferase
MIRAMAANLTINALLAEGAARLTTAGSAKLVSTGSAQDAAAGSAACALDAELLLAHALGSKRARLKSHPEEIPQERARERYSSFIERRSKGEPLAYIVGFRDFWTLRLAVSPAVLVPRPETELLVERALALCTESAIRAVDLGTGSGAIALALASERRAWQQTSRQTRWPSRARTPQAIR